MAKRVADMIAALEAFDPNEDPIDTPRRLVLLFDGFRALPGREAAIPAIFALMERYPTADLGSPGALVHELEAMRGSYEQALRASLQRQPALLSVWMVNRILNATSDAAEREGWLELLRRVEQTAEPALREDAAFFLEHQAKIFG